MAPDLRERIDRVEQLVGDAVRRAGRSRAAVQLLAVSKTVGVDVVREACQLGLRTFGENRAQDLVTKASALAVDLRGGDFGEQPCSWHMIGAVQRNKVAMLGAHTTLWHTVDRVALVDEIGRRAPGASVLLEVNIGGELAKAGCAPSSVPALHEHAVAAGLDVLGLMCIPPALDEPRRHFEAMANLAARESLTELSMGMSGDFDVAIDCGATIIRVGTAIFGPRPTPGGARN